MFFAPGRWRDQWLAACEAAPSVAWITQVWINDVGHRLNLLTRADVLPLLVVAVKVWAGFQQHRGETEEGGEPLQPSRIQLDTYGRWIRNERTDDTWPGA